MSHCLFSFKIFFKNYYLIWLCWDFVATPGLSLVAESRGYSLVVVCRFRAAMASLISVHGLEGLPASVVAGLGFSCPAACGIFLDQGWNLCPLLWQVDSSPLGHWGSLPHCLFSYVTQIGNKASQASDNQILFSKTPPKVMVLRV